MILADGPIAYWRLGEPPGSAVAVDKIGNRPGAYNGTCNLGQVGVLATDSDTAVGFVQGCSVTADDNGKFFDFQNFAPFTMECWIKVSAPINNTAFVWSRTNSSGNGYALELSAGGVSFYRCNGPCETAGPVALNTDWHYLAVVNHSGMGSQASVYVDGIARGNLVQSLALPHITDPFALGGMLENVVLDECAVYPVALTDTQIQKHASFH